MDTSTSVVSSEEHKEQTVEINQPSDTSFSQKKQFSIMESLQAGWNIFKKRPWFFIGIAAFQTLISVGIPFGIQLLFTYVFHYEQDTVEMLTGMGRFFTSIISFILGIGILRVYIESIQGKTPHFNEIFETKGVVIQYVLLSFITGVIIFFGYLALIIPGIILSLMLMYSSYVLIHEKIGFTEAISRSRQLTYSVRLKLFGFTFVVALLQLIGFIMLGIGVFVTGPVSSLALAHVYLKLKEQTVYTS